jgi:hypothetical protein
MGANTLPPGTLVITPQDLDDALAQFLPEAPAEDTGVAQAGRPDSFGARPDALDALRLQSATPSTFEYVLDLPLAAETPRRRPARDRQGTRSHFVAVAVLTFGLFSAVGDAVPDGDAHVTVPAPAALDNPVTPTATAGESIEVSEPDDIDSIAAALGHYRRALTELDSAKVATVWPAVDRQELDRAFNQLSRQDLTFTSCQMSVNGAWASASCTGRALVVAKAANPTPRSELRRWNFRLRKSDDGWAIEEVTAK